MNSSNAPSQLLKSPYVSRDPASGNNGATYSVDRQFQVFEIEQITAATQETRTLNGPTKSGLICTVVAHAMAAGGSVKVALNNSAGTVSSYVTISAAGKGALLMSWPTGLSANVETYQWVPVFANA